MYYTKKLLSLKNRGNLWHLSMPNLVHSLDASNIYLLVDAIANDYPNTTYPIYTIHDCFASLPNNMLDLEDRIKTE